MALQLTATKADPAKSRRRSCARSRPSRTRAVSSFSQIGSPITKPHLVNIVAETEDGAIVQDARDEIGAIAEAALAKLPARVGEFVRGGVALF